MKTKTLVGMDKTDLDNKQWEWQTTASPIRILKQWPDELLQLKFRAQRPGEKIEPPDGQMQRRIDYED